MSTETPGSPVAAVTSAVKPPLKKNWLAALAKRKIASACVLSVALVAGYWTFVASDRYVSESHVIIQSTDLPGGQSMDFSSILGGGDSGRRAEQLLLRDYLLSVDVLKKLDLKLGLRSHYSSDQHDLISRMWSKDVSMERFFHYYQSRVSIEYDDYAGVLVIKTQGFDPKMAHDINVELVREGERFMNLMARSLAQEQVIFLEKQVADLGARASEATHAVVEYQNKRGLVSPQATTESISGIVAKLDSQRAELETRRSAALAYLVPTHPDIVQLDQQIAAVNRQLAGEQSRLASSNGKALNSSVEAFQELSMEAEFTQDVYKTALVALEKGRVEASRTIKKVSILQAPTMPEYSLEPRRLYNTLVFTLLVLLLAGMAYLIAAIVRDHKD